jgi:hypothetical protein
MASVMRTAICDDDLAEGSVFISPHQQVVCHADIQDWHTTSRDDYWRPDAGVARVCAGCRNAVTLAGARVMRRKTGEMKDGAQDLPAFGALEPATCGFWLPRFCALHCRI